MRPLFLAVLGGLLLPASVRAGVYNLKVVTDASPDYSDMPSMVHSITSRWETTEQKCFALFYWAHIARRQTNPMVMHGMAVTDPIRQFNDFGHAMCSTISGINCATWNFMGLPSRYWDISNHTVSEVFYDGRWHMYDNSLSALYTLCDGKTLAGVEDIGKAGSCEKSHGKEEPGHIAKYHCLFSTSPNGFLTGSDTIRSLDEEYRCFNPNGLKYRPYFYDQDLGHRYIFNLRSGEAYTRFYHSLGEKPDFYVPLNGKDPEAPNKRYRLRGNGTWQFHSTMRSGEVEKVAHRFENLTVSGGAGLKLVDPQKPGSAIFRVHPPNIMTSARINAITDGPSKKLDIAVSRDHGGTWKAVQTMVLPNTVHAGEVVEEVNGAYDVLVRYTVPAQSDLKLMVALVNATTQLNSKTQPRLNLGRNTVYVGAGEQFDSLVLWPELDNDAYKKTVHEEKNVKSAKKHPGYMGAIHPAKAKEDAYVVYRLEAPRDLTKLTFGGRFYNRAPGSHIDLLYSLDEGKTWTKSWSLTKTEMPWDVIHYETVAIPDGHRSVLVKYLMNTSDPAPSGCSIYAVRMEANYKPSDAPFKPLDVTFKWKERQEDYSLGERSHTQVVEKLPFTYTIDVLGADHPVMDSMVVSCGMPSPPRIGNSDSAPAKRDGSSTRFVPTWQTLGNNLAVGKRYTLSHPSETSWEAGDPDLKKLTDGVAGPPYSGGVSYRSGAIWSAKKNPVITLDLGQPQSFASVGLNFHGYPARDALKGEIKDRIEVLVSDEGSTYRSLGFVKTDMRWQDLPVNYMWTDEETMTAATFRRVLDQPVTARYIQYRIANTRNFCVTELEVLDSIKSEPFDLKLALPQ